MPLYAFIYILLYFSFILKISYKHSLIYFIAYYIITCLSYAKSKLYILYLSHTRAGVGRLGRFWGRFRGFGRLYPSNGRFVDSWRAFGAFCVRVRACFPCVRACGGVPPPFFARAQPRRVYPLIVYGEYAGEYRVGAR